MRMRRVLNHGVWQWVVDYRDGRGKRRRKFFADHREAQAYAMTITEDVPSRQPASPYSVRNICDTYANATEARRSPRANEVVIGRLTTVCRLCEQHGIIRAQDLTYDSAPMALRTALEDAGYSPHTIKGAISSLRSMSRSPLRRASCLRSQNAAGASPSRSSERTAS